MVVDITDVVTYTNFGDHRLKKGFWGAGGQISPFPIDFHRRPYNTLALPCERVISIIFSRNVPERVCYQIVGLVANNYVDNLLIHNFMPTIVMPTRITSNTATVVGHKIVRRKQSLRVEISGMI